MVSNRNEEKSSSRMSITKRTAKAKNLASPAAPFVYFRTTFHHLVSLFSAGKVMDENEAKRE